MELSQRIRELRNVNGLSQEELARKAQLSLRTIERIELGETEPRGDSLIKIAKVFDLKPEDLLFKPSQMDKHFLPILNLSALSFILFPLLGFVVPLKLWVLKRDNSFNADSKKLFNFQITWSILAIATYIAPIFGFFFKIGNIGRPELIIFSTFGLYTMNFLFIVFKYF